MKKLTLLFVLAACGVNESVLVITNGDRVSELERRANLNDQLNSLQNSLIEANSQAITALDVRVTALENSHLVLANLLAQETHARVAGDDELADQLAAQADLQQANDALLQAQIDLINNNLVTITNNLSSVQEQADSNSSDIAALSSQVSSLQGDLASLNVQLQSNVSSLQSQIDALSHRLDSEGAKVFACKRPDNSLSKERFIKVAGRLYGAMNYVTLGSVTTIAGSTPVTITIPKLCSKDGEKMKSVNGNGNCPNGWDLVAGSGITQTVPSYTTAQTTVVTSVQIALEELLSGSSYVTTDNSPACYFNGNGTGLQQIN